MEIIGEAGRDIYICRVSHNELEKFLNVYHKDDGIKKLKPGATIDLAMGHDFHHDIKDAFRETQRFIEKHQKVVTAILNGCSVVLSNDKKRK